jgi:hypothetical protein
MRRESLTKTPKVTGRFGSELEALRIRGVTAGVASTVAGPTMTLPSRVNKRIRVVKGVALRTVSDGGIASRCSDASQKVHAVGNGLKVLGPYAPSVAAQVIQREPFRDRANHEFVSDAVRFGRAVATHYTELPVTTSVYAGSPIPAVGSPLNLGPEPSLKRGETHVVIIQENAASWRVAFNETRVPG